MTIMPKAGGKKIGESAQQSQQQPKPFTSQGTMELIDELKIDDDTKNNKDNTELHEGPDTVGRISEESQEKPVDDRTQEQINFDYKIEDMKRRYELKHQKILSNYENFKEVIHEREVNANKFHVSEVHELRDRILMLVAQSNEKEEYYATLDQTVQDLNDTLPKLIRDKLNLKDELKEEKERSTFMRHEMS